MPPANAAENARRAVDLLGLMCGEYVSGRNRGAAGELAAYPDLAFLASVADRHGVLPLLARAQQDARIGSPAVDAIRQRARQVALDNLRLSAELLDIMRVLEAGGIDALAYKGPAMAQLLYGNVTLRQSCDLDILVAPADVSRALEALHNAGYSDRLPLRPSLFAAFLRTQSEWQLVGRESGTVVELHWAPFRKYFSLDFPVVDLKRASVSVTVAGRQVAVPAPDDLFLLLCAHGTKHFWYRLLWLVDVALLLRERAAAAQHLLDVSQREGVRRIVLVSVALAARILQLELPPAIADAVRRDPAVPPLLEAMAQSLYTGDAPADKLAENLLLLRCRERWSDVLLIALRLAFNPGPPDWLSVSLPGSLAWLYPLVRVARAMRYLPRLARRLLPIPKQSRN
ncbi:MAG: nucleotidyltransferase family protein [Acidobacteriia bacterium]|nr:nucleotidyltransferase family protein [Terriglobia bacterium]